MILVFIYNVFYRVVSSVSVAEKVMVISHTHNNRYNIHKIFIENKKYLATSFSFLVISPDSSR